jgi:hypothetical protein
MFPVNVHKCPLDYTALHKKRQCSVLTSEAAVPEILFKHTASQKNSILHSSRHKNPKTSYCPYLTWTAVTTDASKRVAAPYSYDAHNAVPPKSATLYYQHSNMQNMERSVMYSPRALVAASAIFWKTSK